MIKGGIDGDSKGRTGKLSKGPRGRGRLSRPSKRQGSLPVLAGFVSTSRPESRAESREGPRTQAELRGSLRVASGWFQPAHAGAELAW